MRSANGWTGSAPAGLAAHAVLLAGALGIPTGTAAAADACACVTPPDPCVVGLWSLAAADLNGLYEEMMSGSPLKLAWTGGRLDVELDRTGRYTLGARALRGAAEADHLGGVDLQMTGSGETVAAYCAAAGKLCIDERSTSLTLATAVPATGTTVTLPLPNARAATIAVNYTCSADRLKIMIDGIDGSDGGAETGIVHTFSLVRRQHHGRTLNSGEQASIPAPSSASFQ